MQKSGWVVLYILACALAAVFAPANAQVTTMGELRGSVVDPTGAVVPEASVTLVDQATGIQRAATANREGGFVFLRLQPGAYRVTAKAQGFQTAVYSGVVVETARTTDLVIQMRIGEIAETVEVKDVATVLEATSNAIATTVRQELVQNLPLSGRDILSFALLTPGAQRGSSDRNSTFNGLPNASLNITLDGVNNNSQRFKSGGTSNFVFAPLRLGAIEEITVSTTGMGADATGQGAMQMRFVTKRGTNVFHGSVFEQFRNDALNANNWFNNARNLPKPKLRQNEFGGNIGGPILKDKLFFFFNIEEMRRPEQRASANTVLSPEAQQGIFRYTATDGSQRTANLLQIAAAAGHRGMIDPLIANQLARMNGTFGEGNVTAQDLFRNTLRWNQGITTTEHYPTLRLDYQITPSISWSGTWNLRWRDIGGTQPWPGKGFHPQSEFKSTYYIGSTGVTWTITPTIINEGRFGVQSNVEQFNVGEGIGQFDVNGRLMKIAYPLGVPPLVRNNTQATPRNNPVYNLYDNLNLVTSKHTLTFGGSYLHTSMWESSFNDLGIPNFTLGAVSSDPITSVLGPLALTGIRTSDLQNAWDLYALLTGRLSGVSTERDLNPETKQYQDHIALVTREAQTSWGLYAQDSFRVRPDLTLNYGLRWEFAGANHNTNGVYTSPTLADLLGPSSRPFAPGELNGIANPQIHLRPRAFDSDYVNPAPNFGVAWNPRRDSGLLRTLLGDRKTVIRASFGMNYYQEGMNNFQRYSGSNPGLTQELFLTPGMPGFDPGTLSISGTIPALNTFPASFSPPFPQSDDTFSGTTLSSSLPELHTPYVLNWTIGVQREIARQTVVEVRYVGNKGTHVWHGFNQNETNIFENGFLQEFKNAQTNLAINRAAGVPSFANRSLQGQVPLPIFEAAFGPRGSQPAVPNNQGFGNGSFISLLDQGQAGALANSLAGSALYLCRMVGSSLSPCAAQGYNAAGVFPINFFQPNPYAAGAALNLLTDYSYSTYNALQAEIRRTPTAGLTLRANYTLGKSMGDLFAESDTGFANYFTLRNRNLNKGPSVFDIRHIFLTYMAYDLPFGQGHRISGNSVVNRIIGGWSLSTIMRLQSGRPFRLSSGRSTVNQFDSGVISNGYTAAQLQDMLTIRPGPNRNISIVNSELVGADGRANTSILTSPTTPGQFGQYIYLYGPGLFMADVALLKDLPITERFRLAFQVEAINAFNHPVFSAGGQGANLSINSTTFGQTTSLQVDPRNIQLRAMLRF